MTNLMEDPSTEVALLFRQGRMRIFVQAQLKSLRGHESQPEEIASSSTTPTKADKEDDQSLQIRHSSPNSLVGLTRV